MEQSIIEEVINATHDELKFGKDNNGTKFLKHIFQLHEELLGVTCKSCPHLIDDYIRNVQHQLNKKSEITMSKKDKKQNKYALKEGVFFRVNRVSYSQYNLTDKIAVQILAANKNRKQLFVKVPENWETQVDVFLEKQAKKEAETQTKEQSTEVEPQDEGTLPEGYEERKKELEGLHFQTIRKLANDNGFDYLELGKEGTIEALLELEFPKDTQEATEEEE